MKTLYLDCAMGAAGDMLAGALFELLPEREGFISELNSLGIPHVRFKAEDSIKLGVCGTHMSVSIHGAEEDEHHHDHGEHHHSGLHEIGHIVEKLNMPEHVRENVMKVYAMIAEAESQVHGVPVTEVHFHEVGALDAIADVSAVCLLMDRLAPEKVIASPVHVGSGQIRCAHGILPVPAPATALLLRGVPVYGGSIEGELCTPTGAALLKYFADDFAPLPCMKMESIGYGMGKKDFSAVNCVRAILGESGEEGEDVFVLSCNIDDMTAEDAAFATERLLEAGALDVYTLNAGMKKSRCALILCVLCRKDDREKFARLIFKHTTTLGIRESACKRYTLRRETEMRSTSFGPVRVKNAEGWGVKREKFEFEDLAAFARENDLSLAEVRERLLGR